MADRVEMTERAASRAALPLARGFVGEHHIARVLRTGALMVGGCFLLSLVLEWLPVHPDLQLAQAQAIQGLRRAAVFLLVLTPIIRLVAAGVMLGLEGEWRYSLYGALVLVLLGVAVMMGLSH